MQFVKRILPFLALSLCLMAFMPEEEGLKDDEALVVVIDHNGIEEYSKVSLKPSVPVNLVEPDNGQALLQKFAVATVSDKLGRLKPGLYTVIASSNDFLYNRMIFVRE